VSGLSRTTIYRMLEAGTLNPVTIRPGAAPRIREQELRAIVEGKS
jgi:predicted DNA-binding transcriptional regulator AlpA